MTKQQIAADVGVAAGPEQASNVAILKAASGLYEVALILRSAPYVTANDVSSYLAPALQQIVRALAVQHEIQRSPTAKASVEGAARYIQKGPDREADFLRAANSGAAIHVAQFDGAPTKKRIGDV